MEWTVPEQGTRVGDSFAASVVRKANETALPDGSYHLSFVETPQPPGLVISHISTGVGNFELVNAGRTPLTFSGQVVFYGFRSGRTFQGVQDFSGSGPGGQVRLEPGERVRVGPTPNSSETQFRVLNTAISQVAQIGVVAVVVRQEDRVLDALVTAVPGAMELLGDETQVPPFWTGPGVIARTERSFSFRRIGLVRTGTSLDWETVAEFPIPPPAALTLPLAPYGRRIAVQPDQIALVQGRWSGSVVISEPAWSGQLQVDDWAGGVSESPTFLVRPRPRLVWRWTGTNVTHEAGEPLGVEIALSEPATGSVLVQLRSDEAEGLEFPAEISLPAGATNGSFVVTPVNDGRVNGTRTVRLWAEAPGYRSADPALVTVHDASGVRVGIRAPERVDVNAFGTTPVSVEVSLDRPADRELRVPLTVVQESPADPAPAIRAVILPEAVIYPGRTNAVVAGVAQLGPYAFPTQLRLETQMTGWSNAAVRLEVIPRVDLRVQPVGHVPLVEGAGLVTNGLYVSVNALLSSNLTVRLSHNAGGLLSLPEFVVLPAMTNQVAVPVVVNDNAAASGVTLVEVISTAEGWIPGGLMLRVEDNDYSQVGLDLGLSVWEPAYVFSGVTNSATIILYSGPDSPLYTAGGGTFQIELDAGVQDVRYVGPSSVTVVGGSAPLSFHLEGAAYNVRLRLRDQDGRVLLTGPFEVVPIRTGPLEAARLEVVAPASWQDRAGAMGTVTLSVRNLGPARAERAALTLAVTPGFALGGSTQSRMELGPLAVGEVRSVDVSLEALQPGFGELTATAGSDNPNPDPGSALARVSLQATIPSFAGGRSFQWPGLQDLAFSAARNRFYATSTNAAGPHLMELDPTTASLTRQWNLPSAPGLVVASANGSQLYGVLNNGTELLRMDLATGVTNLHVALPAPIQDLVASPGRESDVIVYRPDQGIQMIREGTAIGAPNGDYGWLEPDLAANRIGAYAGNLYLYSTVGLTLLRTGIGGGPAGVVGPVSGFRILEGRAYGADGSVAGTGAGFTSPYHFSVSEGVDVLPDAPAQRIYFATQSPGRVGMELAAYDLGSRRRIGVESIPGVVGRVSRLTRWGARGLAFATSGGQVYFVESTLVPQGDPVGLALELTVLPRASTATNYLVRARVTNELSTVAPRVRLRLEGPPSDRAAATSPPAVEVRPGALEWDLGDLAGGASVEIIVPWTAASFGTRWLGGFVGGTGTEMTPADTASGVVVHVEESVGRHLDLAPLSLVYHRALQRFVMSVATVGGLARPGVLILDRQGHPERWLSLAVPAEQLSLTADGSAFYALSSGATEVRRTRLTDGHTELIVAAPANRAFSQIYVNPARSDEVAVSVMRTDQMPSFVEVASYRMTDKLPARVTRKAGFLIPGSGPGEFFGVDRDSSPSPFQRIRFTADGLQWLEELPELPTPDQLAPDTYVGGLGWVHRNVQGGTNQVLRVGPEATGVTTIPGLEEALTLETVPVPVFLKRWGQDLTPRSRRAVPERPVAANLAAAGPDGVVLIGLSGYEGVVPVPYDDVRASRISIDWTAQSRSVAPGEWLETVLRLTNGGPDRALGLRVNVGLYPAERVEFIAEGGARIEGEELVMDVLEPGATAGGILRYRAPYGLLKRLQPTVVTPSFLLADPIVTGDVVLAEPTPVGRFQVAGATFHDLAYDRTRKELWGAIPGTPGTLAVFDPGQRRLVDLVRLDFEPVRLAISDDGKYLYVAPAVGPVRRLNLASRTVDLQIPLGGDSPANVGVFSMAVSPADSAVLAVSQYRGGFYAGLVVFNQGVPVGQPYQPSQEDLLYRVNPGNILFRHAGELVATFGMGLYRLNVTPNGVSEGTVFPSAVWPGFPWFTLLGDRAVFQEGRVVRLEDGIEELALPRSEFLQQNGLPAAELMVGDPIRNQAIAVLREQTPEAGRYVRGVGLPQGETQWTITTSGGGTPLRMLLAGPDTLILSTASELWFLPLVPLETPSAPLVFSGAWSRPLQPAESIGVLNLSLGNPGPADARGVVLKLPADADTAFQSITVEPTWLNAVREPGQIRIPVLPALTTASLRLQSAGRSQLGDYAPTFTASAEGPNPIPTPPSISPVVRIIPLPEVTVYPLTITEGDSGNQQVRIPIRLTGPALDTVQVGIKFEPITAETPADFSFSPGATSVLILPGNLEAVAGAQLRGDVVPETIETFRLRLVSARGARLGAVDSAVITIVDNDRPQVRAESVSVAEGNGGVSWASIPIRLSSPASGASRIEYLSEAETASAGADFSPIRGVLAFAAGQSEAVLRVPVLGDRVPEADESLRLVFVAGPDLRAAPPGIRILILNDDPLVELRLGFPSLAGPGMQLPLETVSGVRYQLERASLLGEAWQPIGAAILGNGSVLLMEDPEPLEDQGFYRVVEVE